MVTALSFKNLPSRTTGKSYQQWKNEVKMWQSVTELDKKRGLAFALSLQGKPREVALEITPEDLNVDEGVGKLIAELDKLFEKDKIDQAYAAYKAFDKFHRESSSKMCEHIFELEQKYNKCKKYDMALPDAIFKLLDNAGLGQSDRHLALTACSDLKFDTMKAALNRIFASKSQSDNDPIVTVKEELAFVGEHCFDRERSSRRFGARNRIDRSFNQGNVQSRLNPTINGSISRCRYCDSKYHWFKIVFGRNPNLPSTLVNNPPVLKGETMSKTMGKHLVGLHKARKAFEASESSEKIRRALRKQVRPMNVGF
ncbi:unnamed protein product [Mytilus coruscus]|uniref:Uncharacterized protein n=1 Tax=Mytilus coruscus TaxID=42192 RepID=A0A6J8DZG4_MYTCO|nr:unnamed protein product [Mytilus coruscus]